MPTSERCSVDLAKLDTVNTSYEVLEAALAAAVDPSGVLVGRPPVTAIFDSRSDLSEGLVTARSNKLYCRTIYDDVWANGTAGADGVTTRATGALDGALEAVGADRFANDGDRNRDQRLLALERAVNGPSYAELEKLLTWNGNVSVEQMWSQLGLPEEEATVDPDDLRNRTDQLLDQLAAAMTGAQTPAEAGLDEGLFPDDYDPGRRNDQKYIGISKLRWEWGDPAVRTGHLPRPEVLTWIYQNSGQSAWAGTYLGHGDLSSTGFLTELTAARDPLRTDQAFAAAFWREIDDEGVADLSVLESQIRLDVPYFVDPPALGADVQRGGIALNEPEAVQAWRSLRHSLELAALDGPLPFNGSEFTMAARGHSAEDAPLFSNSLPSLLLVHDDGRVIAGLADDFLGEATGYFGAGRHEAAARALLAELEHRGDAGALAYGRALTEREQISTHLTYFPESLPLLERAVDVTSNGDVNGTTTVAKGVLDELQDLYGTTQFFDNKRWAESHSKASGLVALSDQVLAQYPMAIVDKDHDLSAFEEFDDSSRVGLELRDHLTATEVDDALEYVIAAHYRDIPGAAVPGQQIPAVVQMYDTLVPVVTQDVIDRGINPKDLDAEYGHVGLVLGAIEQAADQADLNLAAELDHRNATTGKMLSLTIEAGAGLGTGGWSLVPSTYAGGYASVGSGELAEWLLPTGNELEEANAKPAEVDDRKLIRDSQVVQVLKANKMIPDYVDPYEESAKLHEEFVDELADVTVGDYVRGITHDLDTYASQRYRGSPE